MDLKEIIKEIEDELTDRLVNYHLLIRKKKMTKALANEQFLKLQDSLYYLQGRVGHHYDQFDCLKELERELERRETEFTQKVVQGKRNQVLAGKAINRIQAAIDKMKEMYPVSTAKQLDIWEDEL